MRVINHGVAAPIWTHLKAGVVTPSRSIFDALLAPVLPDTDLMMQDERR